MWKKNLSNISKIMASLYLALYEKPESAKLQFMRAWDMGDLGVLERKNILKSARRSELILRCFIVVKRKAHKKPALKGEGGEAEVLWPKNVDYKKKREKITSIQKQQSVRFYDRINNFRHKLD